MERVEVTSEDIDQVSEQQEQPQQEAPVEEGELILGKFKSQEDLVKAYQELQSQFTKDRQQDSQEVAQEDASLEIPKEEVVEEEQPPSQVDYQKYQQEFLEHGKLTDESYAELEKQGIPRAMTDQYIEGLKLQRSQVENSLFEQAGGKESYFEMVSWAQKNLTDEQKATFNEGINGTEHTASMAITWLSQKYNQSNKSLGLTHGDSPGNTSTRMSEEEFIQASRKRDPQGRLLVDVDPAYRAKIYKAYQ